MEDSAAAGWQGTSPKTHQIEPRIDGGMPAKLRFVLTSALILASDRLQTVESCDALFTDLGTDGLATLAAAIYHVPSDHQDHRICRARASDAFTKVRGTRVGLCRRFADLSRQEAAVRLIHEALHHAGMSEKPFDPEALTSREIHRLVQTRCRL